MSERRPGPESGPRKTLELKQTWFLGVMAAAVIAMFAFVILPYVDPQKSAGVSGLAAADFDVPLLSGGAPGDRIRLSDLSGKTVVLDFWASWCKPCLAQSEVLDQLSMQVGPEVVILGLATSDSESDARAFVERQQPRYSTAYDEEDRVAQAYGIDKLPTLLVIEPGGTIVHRSSRILSLRELLELIAEVAPS